MKAAIGLLAALCVVAGPVAAQRRTETETGSRLPIPKRAVMPEKQADLSDPDHARIVLADYARCTLDRAEKRVIAALRTPVEDDAGDKALRKLAVEECLDGGQLEFSQLRFAPQLYRGAFFAELSRRQRADEVRGRPTAAAIEPIDALALTQSADPGVRNFGIVLLLARCVIESDRAGVSELLAAPVASEAQAAAYRKLVPLLGSCLPQGSTIRLSKPILEGGLAEAFYRGVSTPQIASKAP